MMTQPFVFLALIAMDYHGYSLGWASVVIWLVSLGSDAALLSAIKRESL